MPSLQEFISNPEMRAGIFNPDTGAYQFAKQHSQLQLGPSIKQGFEVAQADIQELQQERATLMAEWDRIEKEEMGEQRRVKPVLDLESPDGSTLKGKSGEEMVQDSREAVAPKLEQLKKQIDDIDARINGIKASLHELSQNALVAAMQSGSMILNKYDYGWQIVASLPSKLQTQQTINFLKELQGLVGVVRVNVNNLNHTLDATRARDLGGFLNEITRKKSAGISGIWLRRTAVGTDSVPQTKPVKTPKAPKVPKSILPKKFKKPFKGPKSPESYKRKLYIPQKFIHAWLQSTAGAYNGMSFLDNLNSDGEGAITSIKWLKSGNPCPKCAAVPDKVWTSLDDFKNDPNRPRFPEAPNVIFHGDCHCRLQVQMRYNYAESPNRVITFGADPSDVRDDGGPPWVRPGGVTTTLPKQENEEEGMEFEPDEEAAAPAATPFKGMSPEDEAKLRETIGV